MKMENFFLIWLCFITRFSAMRGLTRTQLLRYSRTDCTRSNRTHEPYDRIIGGGSFIKQSIGIWLILKVTFTIRDRQ